MTHSFGLYGQTITEEQSLLNHTPDWKTAQYTSKCVELGSSPYNLMQPLLPTVTLSMYCAGRIPIQLQPPLPTVTLSMCCAGRIPIQPDATSVTHSYTEYVLCWVDPHTTSCNLCYPQLH